MLTLLTRVVAREWFPSARAQRTPGAMPVALFVNPIFFKFVPRRSRGRWWTGAGLALALATALPAHSEEPALIPWPAKVAVQPGQVELPTGNALTVTAAADSGFGPEAYRLDVSAAGVVIRANDNAGAFYGGQTLRQLVAESGATHRIPMMSIEDAPRYNWRGFMLDVSRHYFDKATLLRVLDWMADYKLNRLHLHLTDDPAWRLEVPAYPELTEKGARGDFSDPKAPVRYFSRDDMRELVAAAALRHIVVVPEIDMPGHASAATRTFPVLDGGANTFNVGNPETEKFLQKTLLQTMDLFPSPWIHFGGDEVNTAGWKTNADVQARMRREGLARPAELENEFVREVSTFLHDHGRTAAGWDETAAARPVPGTLIFWWRHDKPDALAAALAAGYPVVLCPRSPCYFDYPQDEKFPPLGRKLFNTLAAVYQGPLVPATVPAEQRRQVQGVEGCLWTERVATVSYLEFMTLPRLAALAEMAWTPDPGRDFARFETRLQPHLAEYRRQGLHVYDNSNPLISLRNARGDRDGKGAAPN